MSFNVNTFVANPKLSGPGPTCYYCKRKGHVKTECPALAKKTHQNAIVAPSKQKDVDLNHEVMGQEKVPDVYESFVSQGTVSFVGSGEENPVTILRDTGATHSLVLESVLPFQINQTQELMCCYRVWNWVQLVSHYTRFF